MEPGMPDGALLIVDRNATPVPRRIVVAIIAGEYTVKRLHVDPSDQGTLRVGNPGYPHLVLPELSEMAVWGMVTFALSPAS